MWRRSLRPHNRFGSRGAGKAKARYVKGVMNANEERYAALLTQQGLTFSFESITLSLAPRTTLTCDFAVVTEDGYFELHEVKGGKKNGKYHVEPDAWLKLKMAAAKFPWIKIVVVWWHKDTGWKQQEVGSYGADDDTADTEE